MRSRPPPRPPAIGCSRATPVDLMSQHEWGGRHDADILPVDFRHHATDCSRIQRTLYEAHQHFHYSYTAPTWNPRQSMLVVPRPFHVSHRVLSPRRDVGQPPLRKRIRTDRFGNVIFEISIPKVGEAVDF